VTGGENLFGLDVGTSALKGLAIRPDGSVAARAEREYPWLTPRPGWVEQDPESWWEAAQAVLAELDAAAGPPAGIGLSGQMHGLVLTGADERPVRPAILWNDNRTGEQCKRIEREVGRERLLALTGNRALPGFSAPKLLWLRDHEPETLHRACRLMLPKDYVRLRLCGEHATDVADASGTLLLDVGARDWSRPLLDALEVDPAWLPAVLESPAVSGELPGGVPVAAGAGDQAAGALGVGVVGPGPASVVLGTSGVVFAALPRYQAEPEGRLHVFCHAVPGTWHAMGVMLSAAGALEWLRRALGGQTPYPQLLEEAARWPPGVEGLTFLPYLAGERTPHVDPDARGAFVGLALRHDRGALVRAVLEGVALGLRDSLDLLHAAGIHPTVGRVSGGGARSELLLQIVASALELPLERVTVDEGAAFGAALLAGVAAGAWPDVAAAAERTVRVREAVEPVDEWVSVLRERREVYRALYPALHGR
jgi:xylulokinase